MWISSKEAAVFFNIKENSIRQAVIRANKKEQKNLSINTHICAFRYLDGIGGGGKTLQIFIGDTNDIYADENKSGCGFESSAEKTREDKTRDCDFEGNSDKTAIVSYAKAHSVAAAAMKFGANEKSIYRWMAAFARGGKKALDDKRGKNNQKVNYEMVEDAIYSVGSAHVTTYFEAYCMLHARKNRYEFNRYELKADISFSSFYRAVEFLKKDNANVRNFLKKGLDGLDVRPTAIRDYLSINGEWQIDATKIDFMALNELNEPQRYTAVAIIDVATKRRVWELFDTPNSYANVRLLKKALMKLGKPSVIKGDNGKDYVSKHFQGVLLRLGIAYWAAEPFKGWQKGGIERNFKTLQHALEILPGFIGHNAGERIERENQAIEKSKRMSGVKTNLKNLLIKEELQAVIDEHIDKTYNKDFVSDVCDIDFRLFGQAKKVVLHATGVKFNGANYVSLEVFGKCEIGTKLEIIEDIDDYSKVYAYTIDGEFVCEMQDQRAVEWSAEEVKAAQKAYNKQYVSGKKAHVKDLQTLKDEEYKQAAMVTMAKRDKAYKLQKENLLKKPKNEEIVVIKSEVAVQKVNRYMPSIDDAIEAFNS